MHIGFLIYGDINTISGGYLYDRKLIEFLRKQGDKVSIISLQKNNYFQDLLFSQPEIKINTNGLDILVQDELIYPSVYRTNLSINKQLPVISLVHLFHSYSLQPAYINWLYRRIEKKYLATVNGLILNSKSTQSQAKQLMGKQLVNNIIALPAGNNFIAKTDENINKLHYTQNEVIKILYIGNIIKQKGLHVLINALCMLKPGTFKLTITGRDDLEPEYAISIKRLISEHQLTSMVEFTGPLPHESLPAIYRAHHVMALPSHNEAFGIVYLEAMQFGLPVIGTSSGGAKEIINHGINGYLVPADNANKIASHLQHLIETPEDLISMGKNAIKSYQQHPTWEETGHQVRNFLLNFI